MRIRLAIGEPQRAAPRAAENQPAVNLKVLAQLLDVGNQLDRVVAERLADRCRSACAALIEQHDAKKFRIEKTPVLRRTPAAWPAVHEKHRRTRRIA